MEDERSGTQTVGACVRPTIYLASPRTQAQAAWLDGMPVLVSFVTWSDWMSKGYQQSWSRVLIDSGAYSELNSGRRVDGHVYRDWYQQWLDHADAIAGLDDIAGDWKRSLRNYEHFGGFPTFHDSDPWELLPDLVAIAREQGASWIGLGLVPPREGKEDWVRRACQEIPEDLHVHGWALRRYANVRRLDSMDSTNWWRDALRYRKIPELSHLSYSEALEIVVKRYQRDQRNLSREREIAEPTLC